MCIGACVSSYVYKFTVGLMIQTLILTVYTVHAFIVNVLITPHTRVQFPPAMAKVAESTNVVNLSFLGAVSMVTIINYILFIKYPYAVIMLSHIARVLHHVYYNCHNQCCQQLYSLC
jgi:hypothetical protein